MQLRNRSTLPTWVSGIGYWFLLILMLSLVINAPSTVAAQDGDPDQFSNGGMEAWNDSVPEGWSFSAPPRGTLSEVTEDVFADQSAAVIDTTKCDSEGRGFGNLSIRVDGRPLRGKTVRFRAAVKTTESSSGARAQLWFRVDRDSETNRIGAFDNMQARPITHDQWKQYDIVLKVDDDADKIIVGVLALGQSKIWFDDASLEIVDDSTPTTEMTIGNAASATSDDDKKQARSVRQGMSPILMKAMAEAESAPRQPFFTPWLWVVAIALTLFAISGLPCGVAPTSSDETSDESTAQSKWYFIPKFAFRFSFAYWVLYSFPVPLSSLVPKYGYMFQAWYKAGIAKIVNWVAEAVFRIEGELVPPNGSGDTTFSYIEVFTCFVVAMAVAMIWSLVDWRKTDYRVGKDLLRSYLRYVLAFWMLSYGLSKVSWGANQFPMIGEWQFNKRWGDSSPMNVVWTFMGTSRAYTIFAGLGEVIGGLLIIWRRTATLGALVIFGVMINVMMLNFCYDVPVKLFSAHLVCMSLYVLLPDLGRLGNILLFNQPTRKVDLRPPYTGPITIWIHRVLKLVILIMVVAFPIYQHVGTQYNNLAAQANVPDYFGQYEIEEYRLNDEIVDQSDDDQGWRSVRFLRQNAYSMQGITLKDKLTVGFNKALGRAEFAFTDEENDLVLEIEEHASPMLPQKTATLEVLKENRLRFTGAIPAGKLSVILRPNDQLYRVKDRGFRWISEVPFNR